MILASEIVDWEQLGKTAAWAIIAGTVVAMSYSVAVFGLVRGTEHRQEGRSVTAGIVYAVATVGTRVALAAVIAGIVVIARK